MLHNCRLLTESQLMGIGEMENLEIFCNINRNLGSEWERENSLIEIEVESYFSDPRGFLMSLNQQNVITTRSLNQT